MFKSFDPTTLTVPEVHRLLLSTVVPRPIALASTIDAQGHVNLSPFSFFNVFSANPPICIFSPARRVRDNSTKHTLDNVLSTKEVCISIVNSAIVQQVSLASTEYEKGVNEFTKSGLHEVPSIKIKPPRVKESPVSLECRVREVKPMGNAGGAGNLVIAEVEYLHIDEVIFGADNKIDPLKLDPVARLGDNWYCGISEETLFEVEKPIARKGIGVDQLPEQIRKSNILTGNELAILANIGKLPEPSEVIHHLSSSERQSIEKISEEKKHKMAQQQLLSGHLNKAWAILLC